jgi:hypothetical protein
LFLVRRRKMDDIEYNFILKLSFPKDVKINVGKNTKRAEYIREIIDYFLSHPELLFESRKFYVYDYLDNLIGLDEELKQSNIKNESDIILSAVREISPEAASFLLKVFYDNTQDNKTQDEYENDFALIVKILSNMKIIGTNFIEIKKMEKEAV